MTETTPLIEELRAHGLHEAADNIQEIHDSPELRAECDYTPDTPKLDEAFEWDDTKQGHSYWLKTLRALTAAKRNKTMTETTPLIEELRAHGLHEAADYVQKIHDSPELRAECNYTPDMPKLDEAFEWEDTKQGYSYWLKTLRALTAAKRNKTMTETTPLIEELRALGLNEAADNIQEIHDSPELRAECNYTPDTPKLDEAFEWDDTKQGYSYWAELCRLIESEKWMLVRYKALPQVPWNGETPLYSRKAKKYFPCKCELEDYCEEHVVDPGDLQLVICEPMSLEPISEDYWAEQLLPGAQLPLSVAIALFKLNRAIRDAGPVRWLPGDKRPII